MSTTTSVAAPVLLYGPLPKPRPYNLLDVAERTTRDRAVAGFSLGGYPEGVPSGFDPCTEGTFREKDDEGGDVPYGTFLPFSAYQGVECSSLGIGNWEEFKGRVNATLDATISFAAERQLAQGDPLDGVPYLGDGNLDIIEAAAQSIAVSLRLLEQEGGASGRAYVIHAPPPVVSAWSFDGALTVSNGQLQTWLGTPIVVGAGYLGADPVSGTSPTEDETSWAFVTGPVVYYLGELRELADSLAETMDRSLNDVFYRAERDVVVGWDTGLQAGVLVDWTP